jgi:FkbM family methyltransferase
MAVSRYVKRVVKRLARRPDTKLHADWNILSSIGPIRAPHVVIDAGSYHGWFFHCWKDWCPQAVVHAFDADTEACRRAVELYGGPENDIHMNCAALFSSLGEIEFNMFEASRVSSSIYKPRDSVWSAIRYSTGPIESRTVKTITVDHYCKQEGISSIYLLKIDVQGSELELLKGAEGTLENIDHILVESGIETLYRSAPRFTEIADFLLDKDFHLMNMRAWHRGNEKLIETDMLFRRNGLEGEIDESFERTYVQFCNVDT